MSHNSPTDELPPNDTFTLFTKYCSPDAAADAITEVDQLVRDEYTRDNLQKRNAYPSDVAANRQSFAFAVHVAPCPETADLPGLPSDVLPDSLRVLTEQAWTTLGKPKGRLLFNVQLYGNNSAPVRAHFDGEYFEFHSHDDDLTIEKAIRPKLVAVLTLSNQTANGGTILVGEDDETERLVSGDPGDLLVFNNLRYKHRVDSLNCAGTPSSRWIRRTIGWRALDDNCALFDGDSSRPLTVAEAAAAHRNFLSSWTYSSDHEVPF